MDEIFYQDAVQLLGFGESDSYGGWVKFRLLDPEHLGLFRGHAKGHNTGTRFACVLVEIDDNEMPKKQRRTGSQEAFLMCQHPNFYEFLASMDIITGHEVGEDQEIADLALKSLLGIKSKSEIDKNEEVEKKFRSIQKQYGEWVNGRN